MNVLLKAAETAACKAVHIVVAEEVVGPVGVDDEQSGSPERALHLVIMNRLKARTFWSRLIGRKLNSKRGEAVHVVIAEGVVGLVGVNNEQSRSPEIIQTFWSVRLECIAKRPLKARTFWLRFKGQPSSL